MRTTRRLALVLGSFGLVLSFQNCAKTPANLSADGTATSAAAGPGSLMVNSNIKSQQELAGNASGVVTGKVNSARYVTPSAIEFGDQDASDILAPKYRLDVSSGSVMALDSKQVVGQLTLDQLAALQTLLQGAVLANGEDLALEDNRQCAQVVMDSYANLLTDEGTFVIGAGGSSCTTDLYRLDNHQNSGLKNLLKQISI